MKLSLKLWFSLSAGKLRQLFSRRVRLSNRSFLFPATFVLLLITIWVGHLSAADIPKTPNWYYDITSEETFDRNPENTQWLDIGNQLTAVTLEQDQLTIFTPNEHSTWTATQALKPSENPLTAFTIKDINSDGTPELIVGTSEPGYIYIYNLDQGKWILNHYEKYVWSAITQIAAGKFDGQQSNLLVQNQEGFLYLLKISAESLDIAWKSPTVWRQISSIMVLDIDKDLKDEIIVCYKTGGIGVLKLVNSQIVSAWDNYLWGKPLAFAEGDWDGDKLSEVLISTSQKVIYFLSGDNRNYFFKNRITNFNYIAETLCLAGDKVKNQLYTTDTAGKLHCYEYDTKTSKWLEQFSCQTGRIAQIIPTSRPDSLRLWANNHKLITLNAFKSRNFRLFMNDKSFDLNPSAIFQNGVVYVAPKALQAAVESGITYSESKTGYTIRGGQNTLEVTKSNTTNYQMNHETYANQNVIQIIDNTLYFSSDGYAKLFNITLKVEPLRKIIILTPAPTPTPTATAEPTSES
jgi:hypothetical protein